MGYAEYIKFDHSCEIVCGNCESFKKIRGRRSCDPREMYICQITGLEVDELFGYCDGFKNKKVVDNTPT